MLFGKPRYLGHRDRDHSTPSSIGVLIANLGSPAQPTAAGLRPYLRQFLSDPRVIEAPRWLWFWILNCIIVPFRSPRSAAAYRSIWRAEGGSPLIDISHHQVTALAASCSQLPVHFELGMSYGEPSIKAALRSLHKHNCTHLLVLPLYPQYAASTVGAVFDAVAHELTTWRWIPQLRFIAGYSHLPDYVTILADSIRAHRAEHGKPDLTLFSFHGTQLAALQAGDPYHCQCHRTARTAATAVGLEPQDWLVTFQSRFGRDPWFFPATIETMAQLPQQGIKNIHVICPAFAADCLETLEEITEENRAAFLQAGGEKFSYIPALNDTAGHIEFLAQLVRDNIADWVPEINTNNDLRTQQQRAKRAKIVQPLTEGRQHWRRESPDA